MRVPRRKLCQRQVIFILPQVQRCNMLEKSLLVVTEATLSLWIFFFLEEEEEGVSETGYLYSTTSPAA
jgi:hypothetical protein